MHWDIILERRTKNRLNPEIARKTLREIIGVVERNKSRGFVGKIKRLGDPQQIYNDADGDGWLYSVRGRLTKERVRSEDAAERQLSEVIDLLRIKASTREWEVRLTTEVSNSESPQGKVFVPRTPFVVPELQPAVLGTHFSDIYEREAHIRLVHDSMVRFRQSNARIRGHTLLYGPPAAAKTMLFERFKLWYEANENSEFERVRFLDGPTMSKAGLENWLLEQANEQNLPEVIVIEEIEKQPLDNLLTLLSVMGSGYVAKHNARVQDRQKCPSLVWATCNDEQVLKEFRRGALWSRFAHRWYCGHPTRSLMRRIIDREIAAIGGDPKWADKVEEFAFDGLKLDDPREIIALLDGGERLMTGEYQKDILEVSKSEMKSAP